MYVRKALKTGIEKAESREEADGDNLDKGLVTRQLGDRTVNNSPC